MIFCQILNFNPGAPFANVPFLADVLENSSQISSWEYRLLKSVKYAN